MKPLVLGTFLLVALAARGEKSDEICQDFSNAYNKALEKERESNADKAQEELWQEAQYEIILSMEINNCLSEPEPEAIEEVCNYSSEVLKDLKLFVIDTTKIIGYMHKETYHKFRDKSQTQRWLKLQNQLCQPSSPEREEMTPLCEGLEEWIAEQKLSETSASRSRQRNPIPLMAEYTFGNWLTGEHPHHQGPPGAIMGVMGTAQTLFGFMQRGMSINQARNQDYYRTEMAIFNHRFYQANCIGQQSIQSFEWNFIDSSGQPISTNGQAIRSDLSNWDVQGAGNFSTCHPKTFLSPFALTF